MRIVAVHGTNSQHRRPLSGIPAGCRSQGESVTLCCVHHFPDLIEEKKRSTEGTGNTAEKIFVLPSKPITKRKHIADKIATSNPAPHSLFVSLSVL